MYLTNFTKFSDNGKVTLWIPDDRTNYRRTKSNLKRTQTRTRTFNKNTDSLEPLRFNVIMCQIIHQLIIADNEEYPQRLIFPGAKTKNMPIFTNKTMLIVKPIFKIGYKVLLYPHTIIIQPNHRTGSKKSEKEKDQAAYRQIMWSIKKHEQGNRSWSIKNLP